MHQWLCGSVPGLGFDFRANSHLFMRIRLKLILPFVVWPGFTLHITKPSKTGGPRGVHEGRKMSSFLSVAWKYSEKKHTFTSTCCTDGSKTHFIHPVIHFLSLFVLSSQNKRKEATQKEGY